MARTADTWKGIALSIALGGLLGAGAVQAQAPAGSSRQAEDRSAASRQADNRSTSSKADTVKSNPPAPAAAARQHEPHRQPEAQRQPETRRQPEPQRDLKSHDSGRSESSRAQAQSPAWRPVGPAWQSPGPAWQNDGRSLNSPSVTPRPGELRPGEDRFRAGANTFTGDASRDRSRSHDGDRRDRDRRKPNSNVYLGYPYVVPYGFAPYFPSAIPDAAGLASAAVTEPRDEPAGYLRLRVEPRSAQVFVDGAYAGIVDEFGGTTQRLLPSGTHRVEIVAPGYDGITVDVRIPENDTITFARDLERVADGAPATPQAPAVPHKTMYIVPRCYVGDTPPRASDLPAGCSLDDLRVIP